jgi:uncharacterized linocin/CFP29 family protein
MTQNQSQVPWTEEQWASVNRVIQEAAHGARVAASFLPLYGPLSADSDFVRSGEIADAGPGPVEIDDTNTIRLSTLEVKVSVSNSQMADPEMSSALSLFRRAGNILARLEDALIFNGQSNPGTLPIGAPAIGQISGGDASAGLLNSAFTTEPVITDGNTLVTSVTKAIGDLEGGGHGGPFAVVLAQDLFSVAQTPINLLTTTGPSSVPQDRILPLLNGGSLLRSSVLPNGTGLVVALGGAPVELVVATDMSLQFLRIDEDAHFVFRVFEKVVLRVRERAAIAGLRYAAAAGSATTSTPSSPASGGPGRSRQ